MKSRDIKKRNNHRVRHSEARNFGPEAVRVRATDCAVATAAERSGQPHIQLVQHGWLPCSGAVRACHIGGARGMGGRKAGRFDLGPFCDAHHDESGERGKGEDSKRRKFERKYGLGPLRALADEQALAHPRPLGILGLADRWVWWQVHEHLGTVVELEALDGYLERLVGYDLAALMAWTRRRMAAVSLAAVGAPDLARDNLVTDILYTLGGPFEESSHGDDGPTWALCEQAGWPS